MFARLAVAVTVVAVMTGLAGCGGSSAASTLPPLGPLPTIRHESDIVLPLDHYLPSQHERAVLATATSELTARCMERLGFTGYPVESFEADEAVPRHGNTYYVLDDAIARESAYAPSFMPILLRASDELVRSHQRFSSPEARGAFNGTEGSGPAGLKGTTKPSGTPAGGCSAEGRRELYALVGEPEPPEIPWWDRLVDAGAARASSDPRLEPTIQKWSACMKEQGYAYATPQDANNDRRWGDEANHDAAVKAAVADVHCKWSSRYLDTIVALSAAYEMDVVEKNAERLQNALDVRTKLLAAVASEGLGRVRRIGEATAADTTTLN